MGSDAQVLKHVDYARVDDQRVHWRNNEAPHQDDVMEPVLHGGKTHLAHSTVAAIVDVRGSSWSPNSCDTSDDCDSNAICSGSTHHLPGYCTVSDLLGVEIEEYSANAAPKVAPFVFVLLSALTVRRWRDDIGRRGPPLSGRCPLQILRTCARLSSNKTTVSSVLNGATPTTE